MKTWKWNGEKWYCDERSAFKRIRQWAIWIGGWERANGKGWAIRRSRYHTGPLSLVRNIADAMTPVSFLGHRVTWFGWGIQFKPRRYRTKILTISRSGCRKGEPTKIYLSYDGTPFRATTWYRGWQDRYAQDHEPDGYA